MILFARTEALAQQRTFNGGPLSGISVGEVVRPDNGVAITGLLPSNPNSSPIHLIDKAALDALIRALQLGDMAIVKPYLIEGAKQEQCEHGFYGKCIALKHFDDLHVAEHCTFNTPYHLKNGHVRLEWLYNGALWYWSEVELRGGKIWSVRTHPADVPPQSPLRGK